MTSIISATIPAALTPQAWLTVGAGVGHGKVRAAAKDRRFLW